MAEGFIKLYKKMLEWEWYDEPNTKVLFLHCLLKANWETSDWHGVEIKPGQFITSIANLAIETGLSNRQTRTSLARLESTGELTSKCTNKYRIITINKWADYQGATSKKASKRQTNDKQDVNQTTTAKELKNKEIKNIYKYYDDERLNNAFADYVAMRKDIKKPMTDRAIELAVKKLDKLSGGNTDAAIEIINQSIMGGWQGLYPLKGKSDPAANMGGNTRKYSSAYFAELEADATNQWG